MNQIHWDIQSLSLFAIGEQPLSSNIHSALGSLGSGSFGLCSFWCSVFITNFGRVFHLHQF